MKQFVAALDKESAAFKHPQHLFPKLSEAKVKAVVFARLQIKKVIECQEFPKFLRAKENEAWISFVQVVKGFLENHKAENYIELVEILVKNYSKMGCRMILKYIFLMPTFIASKRTWVPIPRGKESFFIETYNILNVAIREPTMNT